MQCSSPSIRIITMCELNACVDLSVITNGDGTLQVESVLGSSRPYSGRSSDHLFLGRTAPFNKAHTFVIQIPFCREFHDAILQTGNLIGGSHANVDLTSAFANGDRFTLPAVRRNHAHQDNRTRSEKPVQGTARF
jgi:hypothetical protein